MKTKIRKWISITVIIITAILLAYYFLKHKSDFTQLWRVASQPNNIIFILLFVAMAIMLYLANGFMLDTLMRPFGIRLGIKESFSLSVGTNFYNMIMPFRGGMALRAMYLKEKHRLSYTNFLSTLYGSYILIFLIGSATALASMIFIYLQAKILNLMILLIISIIFITLLAFTIWSPQFNETKSPFLNRIIKVINGWHLIKRSKEVIWKTVGFAVVQLIFTALITMVSYKVFGIQLSAAQSLFIASISSLSIMISITPGNIGVGDALNVYLASVLGIGLTYAVFVAVLIRAMTLIIILGLGPFMISSLFDRKNLADNAKLDFSWARRLCNGTFILLLLTYLFILLIELEWPRLVSRYLNLTYLLIVIGALGVLSIILQKEETKKSPLIFKLAYCLCAILASFFLVRQVTLKLGWLSWTISIIATSLILMFSWMILSDKEQKSKRVRR